MPPQPPPPKRLCSSESKLIAEEFIVNWGHYTSLLKDSSEKDILDLIDLLDNVRANWQRSEAECKLYKYEVDRLEKELGNTKVERDDLLMERDSLKELLRKQKADADENENKSTVKQPQISYQRELSGNGTLRRSMSESTLTNIQQEKVRTPPKPITPFYNRSTFEVRGTHSLAGSWTNGKSIGTRRHNFVKFSPVFESCDICKKRLGFHSNSAVRCGDCRVLSHQLCQQTAPIPCLPRNALPKGLLKEKASLIYYCPPTHPYIPSIMIYCVIALERSFDHLKKEGIYRLPGESKVVSKVYFELMTSRVPPNLCRVEAETITGCIKKFLKELRDQLIPATSFDEFKKAIESHDDEAFLPCILELPAPNRDTLAYFILHLQKVAKSSMYNKMPMENLARVLAPLIVGYSKLHAKSLENASELSRNQYMILLRLLNISAEFWNRFITFNMTAVLASQAKIPGTNAALLTLPVPIRSPSRKVR